ncbi:MAG: peptidoglycan bridge formation glycyltransferase FemA/FemB family protein [Flavobacteriales bacterium]|nr:peptidoglycan bridge formation glycyltransferase FemA/FemB family protein [Flavobacteriales bacterium]
MKTQVIFNKNPDPKKWDDFVVAHPSGNIFQTPGMVEVYKRTPGCEAGVIAAEDSEGNILGVMAYMILAESGLKKIVSTRSIVTGGPLVKDDDNDIAQQLLSEYCRNIRSKKAIYTEVRNLFDIKALDPAFKAVGFSYVDHLTIHNDLEQSEEDMKKALHRGRNSNIKRARNKGLVVKEIKGEEAIRAGHILIRDTYIKIGLPAPHEKLFLNTAEILGDRARIVGCYHGDILIGCRVYLLFNGMSYDWYAAIDREHSNLNAADLMPWLMMLQLKSEGIKIYDFAGAGKPDQEYSVRDYKLKFGGTLMNFGRYSKIHNPLLYRLGVWGLKLYKYVR